MSKLKRAIINIGVKLKNLVRPNLVRPKVYCAPGPWPIHYRRPV